jgi:hypothetical protein
VNRKTISQRNFLQRIHTDLDSEEQHKLSRIDGNMAIDRKLRVLRSDQGRHLLAIERLISVPNRLLVRRRPAVGIRRLGPLLDLESGYAALPLVVLGAAHTAWRGR